MTLTSLVVVGAAGTGRETLDIVENVNAVAPTFRLLGVLDDTPEGVQLERLAERGAQYLGTIADWLSASPSQVSFVVAIAAPSVRKKLTDQMLNAGHKPATLIHPRAIIGSSAQIGEGSIIYGGAQISTNVQAGKHAIVNMNACVGHDCRFGNFVSINPGATVSGEVKIEDEVLVGGRATILQGLTVGRGTLIGAAALITKSTPSNVIATGIPGRW